MVIDVDNISMSAEVETSPEISTEILTEAFTDEITETTTTTAAEPLPDGINVDLLNQFLYLGTAFIIACFFWFVCKLVYNLFKMFF